MSSDPTGLIREADERHVREVIAVHEGYGEEAWCPECRQHWPCEVRRLRDALAASEAERERFENARAAAVVKCADRTIERDEARTALSQAYAVADDMEERWETAQVWAAWFAAERDDAQQWSQHFEHEMREAQVSVIQFQQECTAHFPDLDDNCGPDEVASAIHMLRVNRDNAFAAIRNMQENNLHREAALAEANATISRVRALHQPTPDDVVPMFGTDPGPWCRECSTELSPVEWPCDTIRATEGES